MPMFYNEGDLMGLGYGSNFNSEQFILKLPQLRASLFNSHPFTGVVSSDIQRRKRKVSSYLLGDYPDENVSVAKKSKLEHSYGKLSSPILSDEGSSCLDEELSCTTSISSVSVHPKSIELLKLENKMQKQKEEALRALEKAKKPAVIAEDNVRAAMLKFRYADTILRARQKLGLKEPVNVQRYKLDAKVELRREVQKQREKQREAARKKLKEVKKSVDVQDSFKVLRDFKALISCSASKSFHDQFYKPIEAPRFVNCR